MTHVLVGEGARTGASAEGIVMTTTALPRLGLANASFITPQLAIGGDLSADDNPRALQQLVELVRAGVTHIVDCRLEWSDETLVETVDPSIDYLWHGMDDAGQHVPSAWFETGVMFALDAMEAPGAVVLTHCHMGINRGPSLGFAVLLGLGWDPVEALAAIRTARPIAHMSYAEDALRWHHERSQTAPAARRSDEDRVRRWRRDNHLDVARVIRRIRKQEGR